MGFGGSVELGVLLDPTDRRKFLKVKEKGKSKKIPIYFGQDDISGVVTVEVKDTRKFEHLGLRIDLVGHLGIITAYLEIFSDANLSTDFMMMSKEL